MRRAALLLQTATLGSCWEKADKPDFPCSRSQGCAVEIYLIFPPSAILFALIPSLCTGEAVTNFALSLCGFLLQLLVSWLSCFLSSKCCSYGRWLVLVRSDKASSYFDLWWNESCHMFHMCPFQIHYGNLSGRDTENRTRQNNNWCYQWQQEWKISGFWVFPATCDFSEIIK